MGAAPFKTVIVGFGRIAAGLQDDIRMTGYFGQASHAAVLREHTDFDWCAIVDPSMQARRLARQDWGIETVVETLAELPDPESYEVLVLATPPGGRRESLGILQGLRGLMVEKPLGRNAAEAHDFVADCLARNLPVQVHYWRRGVADFRALAYGRLTELVGRPQCVFATYGNGLRNNGSHLVDFLRMLVGEVDAVSATAPLRFLANAPLVDDVTLPFVLQHGGGLSSFVSPLDFAHYREVGLDIWGHTGRLTILQESLKGYHYPVVDNRGLEKEREIASDCGREIEFEVDGYLSALYENLRDAIRRDAPLLSCGRSALRTEAVLDGAVNSANSGCRLMTVE